MRTVPSAVSGYIFRSIVNIATCIFAGNTASRVSMTVKILMSGRKHPHQRAPLWIVKALPIHHRQGPFMFPPESFPRQNFCRKNLKPTSFKKIWQGL
jgi:hypothetical protein